VVSDATAKTWLVAYDIREPRRLRRLHRCLKCEGAAVQYSAFCVEAGDERMARLLQRVAGLIDMRADDVRAYHVPTHCRVWAIGRQQMPDGVFLEGSAAVRQLLGMAGPQEMTQQDEADKNVGLKAP
jgi:CRISPR-associated protein Cas2